MEKDKKKIKLITFAPHPNFGTCLQSYALNYVLRLMGHDVEFIFNCREVPPVPIRSRIWRGVKGFIKMLMPQSKVKEIQTRRKAERLALEEKGIKADPDILKLPNRPLLRLFSLTPIYNRWWKWYKCKNLQWKKVFKFTYEDGNFRMRRIFTHKQYAEVAAEADMFITGSDQIWNPYCGGFNPMMFVEFGGDTKRIAYSSSIAQDSFPKIVEGRVKDDLSKFSHIAVRECQSVDLLNKLLGRTDVKLVVDPTFLLTRQEWSDFGKRAVLEFDVPERYIFCYLIGSEHIPVYRQMVEEVKEMTGIKDVISLECYNRDVNFGGGRLYKDAGPYEWVYLIEHASYVCMDSFHATAFALKFEKDFVHCMKNRARQTGSQNSRMTDILSRYGLLYKNYTPDSPNDWKRSVDYSKVTPLVQADINDSMQFLRYEIEN